jgi:hypothetical protein
MNILKFLDFLPGFKTNTGALVLVITTILQLFGIESSLIEMIKKIAEALLGYGLIMSNVRK